MLRFRQINYHDYNNIPVLQWQIEDFAKKGEGGLRHLGATP